MKQKGRKRIGGLLRLSSDKNQIQFSTRCQRILDPIYDNHFAKHKRSLSRAR